MDTGRPPIGGSGGEVEKAVAKARSKVVAMVERMIAIVENPERNSASAVAAAKLVFDVAGVGQALADERNMGMLAMLRRHLTAEAYSEVVRALAADAGVSDGRAGETVHN